MTTLRLALFVCALFLVPQLAAADDKTTKIETIYAALELKAEIDGKGPFKVGDTIRFNFELKNNTSEDLYPPTKAKNPRPNALPGEIGGEQAWIERLGRDATIAVQPARTGRQGRMYAEGGWTVQLQTVVKGDDSLPLHDRKIDTTGYPPGKYRVTMEFKGLNFKVLQYKAVEFELKAK